MLATAGGLAERHERYGWSGSPPNEKQLRLVVELMRLVGKRLRIHHVKSHTGARDVASVWNAEADDLATKGLGARRQSRTYSRFYSSLVGVKWDRGRDSALAEVRQAVEAFAAKRARHEPGNHHTQTLR